MIRAILLAVVLYASAVPAYAILSANMAGKSSLGPVAERQLATQVSEAILRISSAVAAVERSDDLQAGGEDLQLAAVLLDDVEHLLNQMIETASADQLVVDDATRPDIDAGLSEAARLPDPAEAVAYLRQRLPSWPPSERDLLKNLQQDSRAARAAIELMLSGRERKDADLTRLGLMAFSHYQYDAAVFSLVWSLVVPTRTGPISLRRIAAPTGAS